MSRLRRGLSLGLVVLLAVFATAANAAAETPVSPGQEAINQLFLLVLIPAIGIGVLVMVLLTYAVIKFRARKGHTQGPLAPKTHDRRLETVWTVIPAVILLLVGIVTFQTLRITDAIPEDPDVVVEVWAQQWSWTFNVTYTDNGTSINTTGGLVIREGQVVKLLLRSVDVAHAFSIPAFNLKVDVIPGHENVYWFQALRTGEYDIYCAEFCGLRHYSMLATLHVVSA